MELKVIVDNNTYIDRYYLGEPAVCYYIKDEGFEILLDVGYSAIFLDNLKKLNCDINNIGTVVISHGHNDHTRGLKFLLGDQSKSNIRLISHPNAFDVKRYEEEDIGSPYSVDELKEKCDLVLTKEPYKISEHITFLGGIPQLVDFEPREIIGKTVHNHQVEDDYNIDDSALVYEGKEGIYIITGCSHSGICNIIEYAKKVTKCQRVIGVIGGFHLFEVNERVHRTIDYFRVNHINQLYPCHCTSFGVKSAIHQVIPICEVGVGLTVRWA